MESGVNGELIVVFAPNLNKLVAVEFDGMRLNSVEILENAIEFGKNTCLNVYAKLRTIVEAHIQALLKSKLK